MTVFKRKTPLTLRQRDTLIALILIAPSLLIIFGIVLQPILSTFYLSFFDASLGIGKTNVWIGLRNYINLLGDKLFWETIQRTLYFTFISVGLELLLGLGIAHLIHAHPPGWRFLRTSLIIPWAVPTIVNGTMWRWIYNADYGAMNALLTQLGLIDKYIPWLTKPLTAMNLVIMADIWHSDLTGCFGNPAHRIGGSSSRRWRQCLEAFLVYTLAASAGCHFSRAGDPYSGSFSCF